MMPRSAPFLIAAATGLIRLRSDGEEKQSLIGQLVHGVGRNRARRWDSAFVHHVGFWSHFDHRAGASSWPLPATSKCHDLARFARREHILSDQAPKRGEIFLLWSPRRRRFVRCGIVIDVEAATRRLDGDFQYHCHTIEANVTRTARLDGDNMGTVLRYLAPARGDRTIRWTELEERKTSPRRNSTPAMRHRRDLELGRAA